VESGPVADTVLAMTATPGEGRRAAIVGSGPAGFYASEFLLRAGLAVDLYERLPAPFGLVRYGVAPDHQSIKRVAAAFDRTAKHPKFRFRGNVDVGHKLSVLQLRRSYDAVVLAYGAAADRKLGVPGDDLLGSHAATAFVAWYNAHPDFVSQRFDLSHERAVVVGMGNVALDVARVLIRSPAELAETDIYGPALLALRESRIREVVLLGRRGAGQAAFDQGELADIVALDGVSVSVEGDTNFTPREDADHATRKNLEYLATLPRTAAADKRRVRLRFLASPAELVGSAGKVEALRIEENELVDAGGSVSARGTGRFERLDTGLVIRSIGYRGTGMPGVPFDDKRGVIPNQAGRVLTENGVTDPGLYVTGWIKRGPTGLIGTNKACAKETTDHLLADLAALPKPAHEISAVDAVLADAKVRVVSYDDWRGLDATELERGKLAGKLREKLPSVGQMLALLGAS
jgi:ferredoxin--NADP+ reductase